MRVHSKFLAGAMLAVLAVTSTAAPRALLIGIGDYRLPDADLPGIDLDIQNMQELAALMGFKPEEVKVLYDKDATSARVHSEMASWLVKGVTADDPVLVYFSGHGTRIPDTNGDEPDGSDEVLLLQDAEWVRASGGRPATMKNVLVDDTLSEVLANIPSRKVLVLIDACNSGTATRNVSFSTRSLGVPDGVRKFMRYEGMPAGRGDALELRSVGSKAANFAAISAAQDTENAIATFQGGVFTLGVYKAMRSAAASGASLSVAALRDQAAEYIKSKLDADLIHNPVTTGDPALIAGGLSLLPAKPQVGEGPSWLALVGITDRGKSLAISSGKPRYAVGEEVTLEVDIPAQGYLNIITIDARDQTTVLFPNKYQPDNAVGAGKLTIPRLDMPFTLPAQEPLGPTLVVAFHSPRPVDALQLGIEGRDSSGRMQDVFTALSPAATRAISVAARDPGFLAGKLVVEVVAAGGR